MTDSRSPAEPKDPDTILALYRHLAASAAADDLARRYRAGGVGYAEAKALLAEAIQRLIGRLEPGTRSSCPTRPLQAILAGGAIRARKSAAATLEAVRSATGFGWA